MSCLLQDFGTYELWKIGKQDLAEFTKFVLCIYYGHHQNISPPVKEVEDCIKEDEHLYPCSHFYALKTKEGQIFGTINVCLWNGEEKLAIEREYNLDIKQLIKERGLTPPEIWHIGRFAIDRNIIKQNETLKTSQAVFFKLLMTLVFAHICRFPSNVVIVECDKKLYKTGKLLGIFSEQLSDERFVLGSQALPIIDTGAGLQFFFDRHKHLISHI